MTGDGPRRLDEVDRRLLSVLVDHGRMSVNELAHTANVSRATAYARFDRLVSEGTITSFRAELDPAAIGYGIAAIILVKVEQHGWPTARERIGRLPGVEYLALTSGEFDFIVIVRAHDLPELRDVVLRGLHGLSEIRTTETIFVLEEERRALRPTAPGEPVGVGDGGGADRAGGGGAGATGPRGGSASGRASGGTASGGAGRPSGPRSRGKPRR